MTEQTNDKNLIEDISAVQAEHTLILVRIVERLDGIETAIQLLAGNITNMRTELLEDFRIEIQQNPEKPTDRPDAPELDDEEQALLSHKSPYS